MKRAVTLTLIVFSFFAFFNVISTNAYTSPGKPQGFVNDFANTLSSNAVTTLNQALSDFNASTTIQIAVVTIPTLGDETIETYAVKLFEEWKIGQKGKDNGVLFLIAPNDKQVRIEVGYGLEGVLTDAQSNGIIQKVIIPEFKSGNIELGILKGTQAILSVVQNESNYSTGAQSSNSTSNIWYFIQHFGFFILIVLASILGSTKSWWLGGVIGAIFGIIIGSIYGFIFTGIISIVGLTLFGLLFDYIISKGAGKGGRGGGFWGGFGGGGMGGGGFGGFGGGMSGGGGSSGRW